MGAKSDQIHPKGGINIKSTRLVQVAVAMASLVAANTGLAGATGTHWGIDEKDDWPGPMPADEINCGGRVYAPTNAEGGAPGSNYHVRIWQEKQNAIDYLNEENIWILITYNTQYPTWRTGVSLVAESRYMHPSFPMLPQTVTDTFDSTKESANACSGFHFETNAKRSRSADITVVYYFSGLEKTETLQEGYSMTVGTHVAYTETWEASVSTTPPSSGGSVGGSFTFGESSSYTTEESNSVSFTSTKHEGEIGITIGGGPLGFGGWCCTAVI